jgi:lipopolysaccharide heptosyltransferase II
LHFKPVALNTPRRILIARLSSIGDIVLTTPLIRAVKNKYPQARISFLVKKQFSGLLQHNPNIDELIEYNKSEGELNRICKIISEKQFDWFIDIHKSLRTRYLRFLTGIPYSTSYRKQVFHRQLLVWFGSNHFTEIRPVYLKYFDSVAKQGISYDSEGTEVYFSKEDTDFVNLELTKGGYSFKEPIITLCPGASYWNKQWPAERFAETGKILANGKNAVIALLGGSKDQRLCESVKDIIGSPAINLAGKLSLTGSAALLNQSLLVITNDSGMMHLAQSQKKPVLAIFGSTTRELGFFPLPQKSIVVEKQLSCRPCTTKGLDHCPKKHFNCMNLIPVSEVLCAVESLL